MMAHDRRSARLKRMGRRAQPPRADGNWAETTRMLMKTTTRMDAAAANMLEIATRTMIGQSHPSVGE